MRPALLSLALCVLASSGCASHEPVRIRVLNAVPPKAPAPEPLSEPASVHERAPAPTRIGAPGGSGAGSRRVAPAQSGNDTVGGLPVGIGSGTFLG